MYGSLLHSIPFHGSTRFSVQPMLLEKTGKGAALAKCGMFHNSRQQSDVCLNTKNRCLPERSLQAIDCRRTVLTIDNQFSDYWVVILRDLIAALDTAIDADARSSWLDKAGDRAGGRSKVIFRVFGIQAHLNSMSARADLFLD